MKISRELFLLGLTAFASIAAAQTPGTFTLTGNMTTARYGHTATLLADGRVLIAGGSQGHLLASAELYDPVTGTFTPTGNMTSGRAGHTATLLPDGKVLIAGGDASTWVSAELYDPATGTFTPTGNMTSGRAGHTATLLPDGRVLIAAGLSTASAELYDPSTGTFTPTGSLYTSAYGLTPATLLTDGRVLITLMNEAEAELYDPGTATFTKTSPRIPWVQGSAALLMNGKVLLAGGTSYEGESNLAEVYDPSTGAFTPTGNMTVARAEDPATLLPDGTVLIAGSNAGSVDGGVTLASAEVYDPATGTFRRTGDMSTGRGLNTATLLNSGKVLIAGGIHYGVGAGLFSSAEVYTPASLIPAPVLLSLSGDGQGQGAIQHAGTTRIASADDPAVAGENLSVYLHGLADGSVIPPQVAIGGRLAEITFFGNVPGYPGLNVINVRMPSDVTPGPAVPVRLTYLGRPSNQVTIGVALDALHQAIAAMKAAARTDSLNFWQWAWYWQNLPPFSGAPVGFGVGGSISLDVMEQIIIAGGGDALRNISAEQWVWYFRQVVP
jgi:hypothetical protein